MTTKFALLSFLGWWAFIGNTVATVDQSVEAALIRMAPLHEQFQRAHTALLKDDSAGAATAIREASSMVAAASKPRPAGQQAGRLDIVTAELQALADLVENGEADATDLEESFAEAHLQVARFYLDRTGQQSIKSPKLAGASLVAASNHLASSAKWGKSTISDAAQRTVKRLRSAGQDLVNGTASGIERLAELLADGHGVAAHTAYLVRSDDNVEHGIVVGEDHVFRLTPPKGWVLDVTSGLEQGLVAVFYPKGQSWNSATLFAYSGTLTRSQEISTVADAVRAFVEDYHETGQTGYPSGRLGTVPLVDGRQAELFEFGSDAFGHREACAFILEEKTINFVVMTATAPSAFPKSLRALQELAASYRFIGNDPHAIEVELLPPPERWKNALGAKVTKPLRKKKGVRRRGR